MWQTVASAREQCRSRSDHVSRLAGTLEVAEKLIVSPTAHGVEGTVMETVGGAPIVIVSVVVPLNSPGSVTRRRTVTVPGERYVKDGRATVESSYAPSPSRSHA